MTLFGGSDPDSWLFQDNKYFHFINEHILKILIVAIVSSEGIDSIKLVPRGWTRTLLSVEQFVNQSTQLFWHIKGRECVWEVHNSQAGNDSRVL